MMVMAQKGGLTRPDSQAFPRARLRVEVRCGRLLRTGMPSTALEPTENILSDVPDNPVPHAVNRKGRRGPLKVRRLPVTFSSDIRRVITRFFDPGGESRIRNVVERVSSLSGGQVDRLLGRSVPEIP